ncbi:MAG: hypothetical protein MJ178_07860 [Treponemataceae bacterium]|nr:hypothetical protein [Treponemataceae bacterium]
MKLYDDTIAGMQSLLSCYENKKIPIEKTTWPETGKETMILRSEMAYELGVDQLPGIGCTIVTANDTLVPEDSLTLIGADLPDLNTDTPYARIAFVRVDEDTLGEGEKLYSAIRNLEFTRYHFFPEGFMLRISASRGKESVRVGKAALKKGLSFAQTGSMMIDAFKKEKKVKAVSLYYITLKDFDYKTLESSVKKAEQITQTIDHISKNVLMDCAACNLQAVCDEVEGMRELHFGK